MFFKNLRDRFPLLTILSARDYGGSQGLLLHLELHSALVAEAEHLDFSAVATFEESFELTL